MKRPPIVHAGNPVLRARAAPVSLEFIGTAEFRGLVSSMVAVMRQAPGVGLAAPQIGVALRLIVLEDSEDLMARLSPAERLSRGRVPIPLRVLVNPAITQRGVEKAAYFEGCLSVPGYMAIVERDLEVEASALDETGAPVRWSMGGWPARILQHEIDHLDGTLYVDRMRTRTFATNAEVMERWQSLPADAVSATLG